MREARLGIEGGIFRNDDQVIDSVEAEANGVEVFLAWYLKRDSHVSYSIGYHNRKGSLSQRRRHMEENRHR